MFNGENIFNSGNVNQNTGGGSSSSPFQNAISASASITYELNPLNAQAYILTVNSDCEIGFAPTTPENKYSKVYLQLIQGLGGNHAITFNNRISWKEGVAPTISTAEGSSTFLEFDATYNSVLGDYMLLPTSDLTINNLNANSIDVIDSLNITPNAYSIAIKAKNNLPLNSQIDIPNPSTNTDELVLANTNQELNGEKIFNGDIKIFGEETNVRVTTGQSVEINSNDNIILSNRNGAVFVNIPSSAYGSKNKKFIIKDINGNAGGGGKSITITASDIIGNAFDNAGSVAITSNFGCIIVQYIASLNKFAVILKN